MRKSLKIRVKNALKKRAHIKAYRPSLPVAQSWFRTLNRGLFGGRLIEPPIHIGRLMGDWGRLICIHTRDHHCCQVGGGYGVGLGWRRFYRLRGVHTSKSDIQSEFIANL